MLTLRIMRGLRDRLDHHAARHFNGNTSQLVREGLIALAKILDQQEQA